MSSKRTISQRCSSLDNRSQTKKRKSTDFNNYFHLTLKESGLTLKHFPEKCLIIQETVHIIRNIKKNLGKHFEYPRNVSDFYTEFEKECQDLDIFKQYLFPNIIKNSGDSEDSPEDHLINDSVIKILLSVPILQNKLTDFVFEKAIDLAAQSKCEPWIQTILKCFSSLNSIVDSEKISSHLINLLDIASEKTVRLEIIAAVPDIIGDQQHNNVATELSRILSEDHDLIPAILDCLTYLCLSDEQYVLLQKKTLNILVGLSKCYYFPNFVKFLLIPNRLPDPAYLEAVQGLRNSLNWPTTLAKPQDIASSQVLTAMAIRNAMVSSKTIANVWLKIISNCKLPADHKPIDFAILLILFSTSEEKQKQVENLIRKQIKMDTLREELLDDAFKKFKPIMKDHLKNLNELANSLLKSKSDPSVESFACYMYTLMLSELEDCCQTIVAELLQLGLDSKQCMVNILFILNNVALKDMSLLKTQSVQMLTLLDRVYEMPLNEVRAVMNLLCGLAYSYENSVIRDDIHMIIRKELSNSDSKIKIQGILAGIHAVKYLIAKNDGEETREISDDASYSSFNQLAEGDLREAAQIIELISRSTRQFPDMIAFYYDELSKIISSAPVININFMAWLTVAVTNDLQQNFIVDSIENAHIADLKLTMQYCVNADNEMDEMIAINIGGLTIQKNNDVYVSILSPLFQLVQTLHCRQHDNNLSSIDALLGCSVVLPEFNIDLIEDMDSSTVYNILDCLVHCVNWFRELLNAFATQDDDALKGKILHRILQVQEIEKLISDIIIKSNITYKSPVKFFSLNKYTGENLEKKTTKTQASKKPNKKSVPDDTVLPETARTQATQNNLKNKLETVHNINFRPLNLNLLHLIHFNMSPESDSDSDLTVKTLKFLLIYINNNLDGVLISRIKRKTFLSKQEPPPYDPKKAEEYAKAVNAVLPKLMAHLEVVTNYIDNNNIMSTQSDNGFLFTTEMLDHISCLENIYNMFSIYFKWLGFKNHHKALLKTSLRTIANSDSAIISLKDLLIAVAKKFEQHEKYCMQLSTALSLIDIVNAIHNYTDNKIILKILRNMAQNFMSQQWRTPEGGLEKGIIFNQGVDRLASLYLLNNEILSLKNLTLQLTNDIKVLKSRNDTLNSLKCINKSNFPILYRNLGTALHEATKTTLSKGMTNSEHLNLWKDVATVLKYMLDIAKTLENRNNLSAFFKKSLPILKLFISQGIPILQITFKDETQEVLEILKLLQQSTRFLQSLCCHSRLKKDTVLMSKVPFMRQMLETLIYKVKAVLTSNKCPEAFWMGNLKNKDIHGEVIATQASVGSEESVEDCDDQLPDDDDSDSDDENLNPDSKSVSDIV